MVEVCWIFVVELHVFVEDLEEVGFEVASLVQDHLRASFYLLEIFILEFQPRLGLTYFSLKLFYNIIALIFSIFAFLLQPDYFLLHKHFKFIQFILQFDNSQRSFISLIGLPLKNGVGIHRLTVFIAI